MTTTAGAFGLQAFRCISAMYGTTTPKSIERKKFHYCIYFASIVDLTYDTTTGDFIYVPVQYRYYEIMAKLKKFIRSVILLGIMYSIMTEFDYQIFHQDEYKRLYCYFHWKHLLNNFSFACKSLFY